MTPRGPWRAGASAMAAARASVWAEGHGHTPYHTCGGGSVPGGDHDPAAHGIRDHLSLLSGDPPRRPGPQARGPPCPARTARQTETRRPPPQPGRTRRPAPPAPPALPGARPQAVGTRPGRVHARVSFEAAGEIDVRIEVTVRQIAGRAERRPAAVQPGIPRTRHRTPSTARQVDENHVIEPVD